MASRKRNAEIGASSSSSPPPTILHPTDVKPKAGKPKPAPNAAATPAARVAEVERALAGFESEIAKVRETISMGRTRPEVLARGVGAAVELLSNIHAACPEDAAALGGAVGDRLRSLRGLVERACKGRL